VVVEPEDQNFFPITKVLKEERRGLRLTPEGFQALAETFPSLIPDQSRERIEDKSKGDAIAKALVCFQCTKEMPLSSWYYTFADDVDSYLVLRPVSRPPRSARRNQPARAEHARARSLRTSDLLSLVE
jgi:hypothetical protein